MASAEARVHKLSAEAFSRLKNDHEQFLEAYESEWCLPFALRGLGFCYIAEHCMGCVLCVCSNACAFSPTLMATRGMHFLAELSVARAGVVSVYTSHRDTHRLVSCGALTSAVVWIKNGNP